MEEFRNSNARRNYTNKKVKDNCRLSNNSNAKPPHTHIHTSSPPPSHSFLSSHHNAATQHAPCRPPSLCFSPQSLTIQLVSLLAVLLRLHMGFFFSFFALYGRWMWNMDLIKGPNNDFKSVLMPDCQYLLICGLAVGQNVTRQKERYTREQHL